MGRISRVAARAARATGKAATKSGRTASRVAGRSVEGSMNAVGRTLVTSPKIVAKHPVSSGAAAAYTVGYVARGHLDRQKARSTEMNDMMRGTPVKYRAQDKHPSGGTY